MLVGREAELAHLHRWLDKAVNGQRQVVFVTGEPGIGKTALVEAFLRSLESRVRKREEDQKAKGKNQKAKREDQIPPLWIGRGQCIEHYGAGEAYMPVLEALGTAVPGTGGVSDWLRYSVNMRRPGWSRCRHC